jgi:uncharacterized protein
MELGRFSVSLAVKDLDKSLAFYEAMGFKVVEGGHVNEAFPDTDQTKWRILSYETVNIGLFQGMFENNIFTFNPVDVRSIQRELKQAGIVLGQEADENSTGQAYITLEDPDGNQIMFDQIL